MAGSFKMSDAESVQYSSRSGARVGARITVAQPPLSVKFTYFAYGLQIIFPGTCPIFDREARFEMDGTQRYPGEPLV
jgi:hypothetical protein